MAAIGLLGGCSSWKHAHTFEGWTLYRAPGTLLKVDDWQRAFEPALVVVEREFGPFQNEVRVHAWRGSVALAENGRRVVPLEADDIQDVPGIGPARVQGYHARGGIGPWKRSGVFLGTPDAGTAVHELIHARLAEETKRLPLWLEEGIATWFGDGALHHGVWTVDGFACWPWRELRSNALTDADLAVLLSLGPQDDTSVRDNVLVHFLGWAIVFDLALETGSTDWRVWQAHFDWDEPLADARLRLDRTLRLATPGLWMERLRDEDPGLRFAAAKGTWKLASLVIVEALVSALEAESEPEVQIALAINLLAAANDLDLSGPLAWRVHAASRATLRAAELPDPIEQEAIQVLFQGRVAGEGNNGDALEALRRFWAE
jgi:hypothetical protein